MSGDDKREHRREPATDSPGRAPARSRASVGDQASLAAMRRADPRTIALLPLLAGRSADGGPPVALDWLQGQLSGTEVNPNVPEVVRSQLDVCRALHLHGLFVYEFFTIAAERTLLVLEAALGARFLEEYPEGIPLEHGATGEAASLDARSYRDVVASLAGRPDPDRPSLPLYRHSRSGKTWNLVGHPRFNGSAGSLLEWARNRSFLRGQRNRVTEEAILGLRNLVAHPHDRLLIPPHESARTIRDVGEIVNHLWGHDRPGGRLYGPPSAARVFALRVDEASRERMAVPTEALLDVPPIERFGLWYLLIAADGDGVLHWRPDVEATSYPTRLIAGPIEWSSLLDSWHDFEQSGTETYLPDWRDRIFAIRRTDSGFGPCMTLEHLRDLEPMARDLPDSRWLIVRADHPGDVYYFLEEQVIRAHSGGNDEAARLARELSARRRRHFPVVELGETETWEKAVAIVESLNS